MNHLLFTLVTGVGATILMDLWGVARKPLFGIAPPQYGMVGRWLAHMTVGRFRHDAIAKSPAVPGEHAIGWIAHYLTGIAFATLLVGIGGPAWVARPTAAPALAVGIGTLVVPYFLVQPAMGAGVAAARTPHPTAARLQSFVTHLVFGFGLFAAGRAARFMLST
jgi:hypothetical protein